MEKTLDEIREEEIKLVTEGKIDEAPKLTNSQKADIFKTVGFNLWNYGVMNKNDKHIILKGLEVLDDGAYTDHEILYLLCLQLAEAYHQLDEMENCQ